MQVRELLMREKIGVQWLGQKLKDVLLMHVFLLQN